MTPADLDRIEQTLGLVLPAAYREVLARFPVPAYAGNAETGLWDDADGLIRLNRDLHGRHLVGDPPWPRQLFCLGTDGTSAAVMDLWHPDAPVFWAERNALPDPLPDGVPFLDWAVGYAAELRDDLKQDGIDPDTTPDGRDAAETSAAIAARRRLIRRLVGAAVGVLAAAGVLLALRG